MDFNYWFIYYFCTVLSRPKDELIGIEELDLLQSELELLLTSAAKWMRVLHNELDPVSEPKDTKPVKDSKGKDIRGKGSGKGVGSLNSSSHFREKVVM